MHRLTRLEKEFFHYCTWGNTDKILDMVSIQNVVENEEFRKIKFSRDFLRECEHYWGHFLRQQKIYPQYEWREAWWDIISPAIHMRLEFIRD